MLRVREYAGSGVRRAGTRMRLLKTIVMAATLAGPLAALSHMDAAIAAPVFKRLHSFTGGQDGAFPPSSVTLGKSGSLYGATGFGGTAGNFGTVFEMTPPATGQKNWRERIIYRFQGTADGARPFGRLIFDAAGHIYGVTQDGGLDGGCFNGCGTVYMLTKPQSGNGSWTKTTLYSFKGGKDGSDPVAGLLLGTDGSLYGVTVQGGSAPVGTGIGTVFQLVPPRQPGGTWVKKTLVDFTAAKLGANPNAMLIADSTGLIYGTTSGGGNFDLGTVFTLKPPAAGQTKWTHTIIHHFKGGTSGSSPYYGGLVLKSGALFGTTPQGGHGTVFKLTPPATGNLWKETVLYRFKGGADGASAFGIVFNRAGEIFGGTALGGGTDDGGTIYKLVRPTTGKLWTHTVLHRFSTSLNGHRPSPGLALGGDGTLYGATEQGGTGNPSLCGDFRFCGTVFQLKP